MTAGPLADLEAALSRQAARVEPVDPLAALAAALGLEVVAEPPAPPAENVVPLRPKREQAPAPTAIAVRPPAPDPDRLLPLGVAVAMHDADPEREPWPADWLSRRDPTDYHACRKMWAGVLWACLRSAALVVAHGGKLPANVVHNLHAEVVQPSWVGSRDFHMICALAGFDGSAVAHRVGRALADRQLSADLSADLSTCFMDRRGR